MTTIYGHVRVLFLPKPNGAENQIYICPDGLLRVEVWRGHWKTVAHAEGY